MSLESHLEVLKRKHQALDEQIIAATRAPSADRLNIQALKKRKLKLKEQIERQRTPAA